MNYFLKLLSALIGGKSIFTKKILYSLNAVISTNENTEFITSHVGGSLEEELHYFAAKNGWEGWAHLATP